MTQPTPIQHVPGLVAYEDVVGFIIAKNCGETFRPFDVPVCFSLHDDGSGQLEHAARDSRDEWRFWYVAVHNSKRLTSGYWQRREAALLVYSEPSARRARCPALAKNNN